MCGLGDGQEVWFCQNRELLLKNLSLAFTLITLNTIEFKSCSKSPAYLKKQANKKIGNRGLIIDKTLDYNFSVFLPSIFISEYIGKKYLV